MFCCDCKYLDKNYEKNGFSFPIMRCNKKVITYAVKGKIYSINDICEFKKVIT